MSSQVPIHHRGGSNASNNGESPRPATYSDKETSSTSSSSGSSSGRLMELANPNRQALLNKAFENRREELEELRRKLEASKRSVKTLEVETRQSLKSDAGGHDYNLPFPSQNELIKRVKSFHEEFFGGMMYKVAHVEHSVTKHMLVSTVKQCHDLAQRHVKERLKELDIFLLGNDHAGNSHGANMSAYANDIAGRAFKKVHQYMFGQFYPSEGTSSVLLGEVKEEVVKSAASSIHASMTSFIRTGGEAYEVCIMKLLQTFLECELTRPTPLKFSDSFGAKEHWDSSLHIGVHALSVETEEKTDVQVILPGLYLAEGANETKPEQFVTKPVVICCESSASAGGDKSMTD